MDAQPVQTTVLPDSGGGGSSKEKGSRMKMEEKKEEEKKKKKEEGSPSIKLGLGIDGNVSEKPVKKHGKCVLTTAQMHELQLQGLIFKYIAGGIPVPVSLIMPIWKGVASSFGSAHGARSLYDHFPSFLGIIPQGFDYRDAMDPEPGRCRRTDGKKWRCSKNVIPDQKYCAQHMHRGCRRSRKPVEPSQITLPDSTLSKNSKRLTENSKNHSRPFAFQYMNPSSCISSTSHATTATESNVCSSKNSNLTNATTSKTIYIATKINNKSDCKRSKTTQNTSDKGDEKLSGGDTNIINRSSNFGNKDTVKNSVSAGVGFSPKSVLQVQGCGNSRICKNGMEPEPGRCRRTDGKRWRCSRDVIPFQKYCARHMHRGARKHIEVAQPVSIPTIADCPPNRSTIANKSASATLSTSLSISIPSTQPITQDEKSMSSSSETTISDTTLTFFKNGNFS